MNRTCLGLSALLMIAPPLASATDVWYPDDSATSRDGRYQIVAKSPQNRDGELGQPFADNFTYTLRDLKTKRVLWQRKQKEREGSCGSVYVSDGGRVVIYTGWDNLIVVDPSGKDVGTVDVIEDGFSAREQKNFVSQTTAGPMWAGYSHWYFAKVDNTPLFVIRPWWDRRVLVDLRTGKLTRETLKIRRTCDALERDYVLSVLKHASKDADAFLNNDRNGDATYRLFTSIYVAGKLGLEEAVPMIRAFEVSDYSGSSTMGGLSFGETYSKEIDPHSYSTFTVRQLAGLSLRRLGAIPRPFPVHEFEMRYEDSKKDHPFEIPAQDGKRHEHDRKIAAGMSAEAVLRLIGSPDVIGYDTWEYDMDAKSTYTLVVTFDDRKVTKIKRVRPARWKSGTDRDQSIIH